MKAAAIGAPPFSNKWLYEVKFDGYRVIAVKNRSEVELWSRNENPLHQRFPDVVKAVSMLPVKSCILDGEVCALDANGKSSFQLLQNQGETNHPVVYYAFDILFEGVQDLRAKTLLQRKTRLEAVLANAPAPICRSNCFVENPKKILETMKLVGAEGAIAKLIDSPYQAGTRSKAWIKIKFHMQQEFVIVGYTLSTNSGRQFGALSLGYYQGKRLIYAGRVGTGFTEKMIKDIFNRLKPLEIPQPMVQEIQEPSGRWRPQGWKAADSRWVKPLLVAQVQFTEWTEDGILRHPSFLGMRDDKKPTDVVRESS